MTMTTSRDEMVRLQQFLLPPSLPDLHCTEAAAAYRPHNHEFNLGGDWYDLVDLNDRNEVVAIVGDVVGHGLEQIMVMGQLRAASNALARVCAQPTEILTGLDGFATELPGAVMTTMAVLVLDGTRHARVASAGHLPLLHLRGDGSCAFVEGGRRMPLGMGGVADPFSFEVDVGDVIVLYTDGVVERRDEPLDRSMVRLAEFSRRHFGEPCHDIAAAILDQFAGDTADDAAVLVLRPVHQRDDNYLLEKSYPAVAVGQQA